MKWPTQGLLALALLGWVIAAANDRREDERLSGRADVSTFIRWHQARADTSVELSRVCHGD